MGRLFFLVLWGLAPWGSALAADSGSGLSFSKTQQWGHYESWFLDNWKPRYVGNQAFGKQLSSFPQPPALNSPANKREMDYLHSLQSLRNQESEAVIEREKHVCGFWLGPWRLGLNPDLDHLLLEAYFDARLWGFMAKKHFNRVRPSYVSNKLRPSIDNPPHPAYPSNHTFQAVVLAGLLGQVFPEQNNQFLQDALKIGRNRELAGVHYPSDTDASVILAERFLGELEQSEAFQKKLKSWKAKNLAVQWRRSKDQSDFKACQSFANKWATEEKVWK